MFGLFDIAYRGFAIWAAGIVLVLGSFLIFVAAGWPGSVNSCVWGTDTPPQQVPPAPHASLQVQRAYQLALKKVPADNSCYCEAFSVTDAIAGKPGVRQKVNTWFNLYAILTSLVVAIGVYVARSNGASNLIGSRTWVPDAYIFAVLFLGLGSMWFHGAIKEWAGLTDTASMYTFTGFLIFYTLRRLWDVPALFWIGYPLNILLFVILGEVFSKAFPGAQISLILILIQVAAYMTFQIWLWVANQQAPTWRWYCGVGCILAATFFWSFSQKPGQFLCTPTSSFQPHGLLWHPLAGGMAVFLYFYWRFDTDDSSTVDLG